ncbi:MAG: glycoside hydrolase family 9 protein [Bacteroidales bacterium]|nr:glycoside hydrolase family 9 protein [Bacteroidales bacterium]
MRQIKAGYLLLFGWLVSGCGLSAGRQTGREPDGEWPVYPDRSRSFEAFELTRPVLEEQLVGDSLCLAFDNRPSHRAVGPPDDPDYASYGNVSVHLDLSSCNLEGCDRVAFRIFPSCPGAQVVNLDVWMDGLPANHLISLENGKWNHCTLNIGGYSIRHPERLRFSATRRGIDLTTADSCRFVIDSIRFQRTADIPSEKGWIPDHCALSTAGYSTQGPKTAVFSSVYEGRFTLCSLDGKSRYRGVLKPVQTTIGRFGIADFSDFIQEGEYVLKAGDYTSQPFRIATDLWDSSVLKAVNFLFCQRCGYPVPQTHGTCHQDLFAEHNGVSLSFCGGWHDAGDLSQQSLQTGDVTFALLEMSEKVRKSDPALFARLREEARWGLDFILRTRFGDGFRASSVGLLIWQDGKYGTFDDIHTVRVQNNAFDNYLQAGYEAYAARVLTEDPAMQDFLLRTAKEDFAFAEEKFARESFDKFRFMYEHCYNTSHSQYLATVSWAASQLYRVTGDSTYARRAAEAASYVLDCQETASIGGLSGFFYRDTTRRSIVHYIHQSREQFYMQALSELCLTQKGHPDQGRWEQGIRLFGSYLKGLMQYTAPYGMIPSGIYAADEYLDTENFYALHLFPPQDAAERYSQQLALGEKLDATHFVKRFPVWFNIFNGNNAVLLSLGKSAAVCGHYLGDRELLDIAREQVYWMLGKNPFCQSMVYGEGWNYPDMDNFSSGLRAGMMPVGIRTYGDTDEPYWPQVNNACYKEVWVTVAGKYLSLLSEL